ncbi:hypothetical protein NAT51_18805 [Flavobacterium amniphilum]|uniref:vitamin K epoxide reductase family protein n=1 Tax=Flavobacterium amniphilum TaxID=1834035 RepID=UPI00202A6A8D|nr:vitamin K epoxide reductase family protein [Flavobacterium amniphilum]MCL9807580.1 hypothetical protein [Flavobacterium amniphilum]
MHLVKKLLIGNKYSNFVEEFEDLFSSHPNYPSLFAITDSLSLLGIENLAIKIPKEQFAELPDIFLTLYKGDLVLLTKGNGAITILDEKGKKTKLGIDAFLLDWDQIIIAVEPNTDKQTAVSKKPNWVLLGLPVLLLILLSSFLNGYTVSSLLLLGASVFGLFLSVLILQEKFGIKTELVSKFCNMNQEASCDSVIKSDQGRITGWLTFADLPLLFFGANFFSLLLNPIQSVGVISGLSLLAIPFLMYSVWIQKVKIKKWCLLCLAVSAVISVQGIAFVFHPLNFGTAVLPTFLTYLFSVVLIFSGWSLIKPVLEKEINATKEVKELKRFKRNFKVFQSLTKEVKAENNLQKLKGIEFGNGDSGTSIVLFLSPSCGHCHKAFEDAYKLYEKNPETIRLKILFNVNPENGQNKYKVIVENLLYINSVDSGKAQKALIDWHINALGIDAWKEKWGVEVHDMLVNNEMHSQYSWCAENEFNYSPVKIVNSKLFPNEYEIADLYYFINDFEEESQLQYDKNSTVTV